MYRIQRQQGGTLIVGLIVLLVLTVIGVTGMKVTTMEEKMAGNARDHDLAFQAADSALRAGERCILNLSHPPMTIDPKTFSCNLNGKGFYPGSGNTAIWDILSTNHAWGDVAQAVPFAGGLAHISTQPSYVVEQIGVDYGLESGTAPPAGTPPTRTYRVTAHATGGTRDAVVILQSTVGRN